MPEFKTEAEAVAKIVTPPLVNTESEKQVALKDGYKIVTIDTEKEMPCRERDRGVFVTGQVGEFDRFIQSKKIDKTPVFISEKSMNAVAIFNYITLGQQGHCDNTAKLSLDKTPAFEFLSEQHNQTISQKSFATMLEDWGHILKAENAIGETIPAGQALNAVRNMTIESHTRQNSHVDNMSEERSALARVEAKSATDALPAYFTIEDACYIGLPNRKLRVRLLVKTGGDEPKFAMQIVGYELIKHDLLKSFKEVLSEQLKDEQIFIGNYSLVA